MREGEERGKGEGREERGKEKREGGREGGGYGMLHTFLVSPQTQLMGEHCLVSPNEHILFKINHHILFSSLLKGYAPPSLILFSIDTTLHSCGNMEVNFIVMGMVKSRLLKSNLCTLIGYMLLIHNTNLCFWMIY